MSNTEKILKERLTKENYSKLMAVNNTKIHDFIADAIELTNPDEVFVCTDSKEDVKRVRKEISLLRVIPIILTVRKTRAATGKLPNISYLKTRP